MNEYVNTITLRSSLDQGDRFGLITSPRREVWAHHFTKKRGLSSSLDQEERFGLITSPRKEVWAHKTFTSLSLVLL
jgi:ligand-binding SRPBCC domain-containing protein